VVIAMNNRSPLPGLSPNVPAPLPLGPQPPVDRGAPGGRAVAPIPPPLEPAEYVERAQPPLLDARIKPQPNQRITTPDGTPIDLNAAPPDKIAIGDLAPDGKATLELDLTIDASGRSPARSIDFLVDGHRVERTRFFNLDRPIPVRHEGVKLALALGPHRFTAEVENELGVRRPITRDILVQGIPGPHTPRFKILTIAPSFRETRIPLIPFVENDVKELHAFLKRHVVSAEDEKPIESFELQSLEREQATFENVQKEIDALKTETFSEGDLLIVIIKSHVIHVGSGYKLVAADGVSMPPKPAVDADALARSLGAVAGRGCKVLVLLDGVHTSNKVWDTDIIDWVRNLRDEQNVITFVASKSGPSQTIRTESHGAFALAILNSVRPPLFKRGVYSLNDFRDVVIGHVLRLTKRQQQAGCYLPESISGQFSFIDPLSTGR
jgi:hypothetical protein